MTISAEIQRFDRNRDGYVEYFIKVVYNGRQWSIRKRYKEFATLNEFMEKNDMEIPYPLPPKFPWRRHDDKMLKLRRKELQQFLDSIVNSIPISSNRFLKEFLEVDMGMLGSSKKMPKALGVLDRMRTVPDEFHSSVIQLQSRVESDVFPVSTRKLSVLQLSVPFLRKSKSLSFSTRSGSKYLHRDSFAGESSAGASSGRDRKASVDYFQIATNSAESSVSKARRKFVSATNSIWIHYADELNYRCYRADKYSEPSNDCALQLENDDLTNTLWAALSECVQLALSEPQSAQENVQSADICIRFFLPVCEKSKL